MKKYKVSFYTKHNTALQSETIKANSEAEVRSIYASNACEVVSIDEVEECVCIDFIGDNGHCPVHGKGLESNGAFSEAEIKADYQECNELYMMGMGA